MRISAMILVLLLPVVTFAQTSQGMNEQDMQKLTQQMQRLQSCMQNVDQAELQEIQQRSVQVEAEIKALCAEGKRDEAQQRAISFGRDMVQNPTMQEMRSCGDMLKNIMPMLPMMDQDPATPARHVCDAQ